jgi:hypothetical protein
MTRWRDPDRARMSIEAGTLTGGPPPTSITGRTRNQVWGLNQTGNWNTNLVDHVLPHAPVRQWVLSFPFRIRFLLASSPRLCAAVRGIVTRTLLGWLEQRALAGAAEGFTRSRSSECDPAARREPAFAARSGAVLFAQRFGSALNLNLHFHALLLDGAFVSPASVRRRRPHLPALRRPTPPHSAAHRPSRRAQDPRPPRTAHRASTVRTDALTRAVRLRLSRSHPHAAEHAPRPQPAPASRPARSPSARSTARVRVGRLASTRSTASASLGEPPDGTDCRGEPPPRGPRRPPPAEVIRLEVPSAARA